MTAAADKIVFTCASCNYKARIPGHYAGRTIHCPSCKTVQPVAAVEEAGATVATVSSSDPAPLAASSGKIVFTCSECSYKGRLSAEYDGKTIRCPGCQKPQLVKGAPVTAPIVASFAADETNFKPGESDKIRFECSGCGYRAKIPAKYANKPIHCPQCKQVATAKPETDLEEATGRTVTISKVSQANVREARLAVTNVGVQFMCAVCGYESRISPSCAGDAVYCPSCRAPQKVEWGDPAALKAAVAEIEASQKTGSGPVPVVAPSTAMTLNLPTDKPTLAPIGDMPKKMIDDVTDIGMMLLAEPEFEAPVAMVESRKGGRRVVSVAKAGAAPLPAVAPLAPVAKKASVTFDAPPLPTADALMADAGGNRGRRTLSPSGSVKAPGSSPTMAMQADDVPSEKPSLKRPTASAAVPAPVMVAAPAPNRKPLIIIVALMLVFGGLCGYLAMSISSLKTELSQAREDAEAQRKAAKKAAEARAEAEAATAKADAEAAAAKAESTKVAEEAKARQTSLEAQLDALHHEIDELSKKLPPPAIAPGPAPAAVPAKDPGLAPKPSPK